MSVNVPQTIYAPADGHGRYSTTTASNIVDTVGVFLVDTVGTFIIDTGNLFAQIPATVWAEDNGV